MIGGRLTGCATQAIFLKSMRLTQGALKESQIGKVVNLQSKDAAG